MSQSNHQKSIHKMQRYVVSCVVLMSAIAVSFPIAMVRVSATNKFPGQSVKSRDCAGQTLKESKVIEWAKDCAPLKVEPKKAEVKPAEAKPAEAKPAEATPTEVKPAEATPTEVKSVEATRAVVTEKTAEDTAKTEALRSGMTEPERVELDKQSQPTEIPSAVSSTPPTTAP